MVAFPTAPDTGLQLAQRRMAALSTRFQLLPLVVIMEIVFRSSHSVISVIRRPIR